MNGNGTNGPNGDGGGAKPKKGGVMQLAKAVAWAFFGIRRRADLESDVAHLNPVALILAAIIGAALFIVVLLLVVHAVVG